MIPSVYKELEFLKRLPPERRGNQWMSYGLYKCFCGNEFKALKYRVKIGKVKSCGCIRQFHGMKNHRLYGVWASMISRCYKENNKAFKYYGGRGIKVCDRWLNSFETFVEDVSPTYVEGLSIDRYPNNDGNYEPTNFRWATAKEQNENKRPRQKTKQVC